VGSSAAPDWRQLSGFIAGAMGLHFPEERWADLQRGVTGAAAEFGFKDTTACAKWLLSAPLTKDQLQVLASHLTIGETYFFRDKKTFDILASSVLPGLIQSRRGREQRLRIWSAACCTGEEAYSLAISLRQVLPDWKDWQLTILATDINPRFLRKAMEGSYGEWSFRNTPADFREHYFNRTGDGRYDVIPEIKSMVTFSHLNLAEDSYPSLATDTNAMDLVFCRNVLMYFSPVQIERVIANLHHSLIDGGWLAVSASETSQALFARFATRNFPGAILYQKSAAKFPGSRPPTSQVSDALPIPRERSRVPEVRETKSGPVVSNPQKTSQEQNPMAEAEAFFAQGRYEEAADALTALTESPARNPRLFSLLARTLANQGRLGDALGWCDQWIAADKVDPAAYYLRAIILLEQGEPFQARNSLQRATYLSPTHVLAHFALGNLARGSAEPEEALRHFTNARQLLSKLQPDDPLPESDGLTASRLTETINALTILQTAL
jgi:chemotaxis protein methyltransferase CheR